MGSSVTGVYFLFVSYLAPFSHQFFAICAICIFFFRVLHTFLDAALHSVCKKEGESSPVEGWTADCLGLGPCALSLPLRSAIVAREGAPTA